MFSSQNVLDTSFDVKKVENVFKFVASLSDFLYNSVRVYPIKLKIGMLYYMNNTFQNTVF